MTVKKIQNLKTSLKACHFGFEVVDIIITLNYHSMFIWWPMYLHLIEIDTIFCPLYAVDWLFTWSYSMISEYILIFTCTIKQDIANNWKSTYLYLNGLFTLQFGNCNNKRHKSCFNKLNWSYTSDWWNPEIVVCLQKLLYTKLEAYLSSSLSYVRWMICKFTHLLNIIRQFLILC